MTEKVKVMWKREEMMEKAIELTQNAQKQNHAIQICPS